MLTDTAFDPDNSDHYELCPLPTILDATGLDAIVVTDPGGISSQTTLGKMIAAIWRSIYKKSKLSKPTGAFVTYADDGTTVRTTATITDDGSVQTKGAAS